MMVSLCRSTSTKSLDPISYDIVLAVIRLNAALIRNPKAVLPEAYKLLGYSYFG